MPTPIPTTELVDKLALSKVNIPLLATFQLTYLNDEASGLTGTTDPDHTEALNAIRLGARIHDTTPLDYFKHLATLAYEKELTQNHGASKAADDELTYLTYLDKEVKTLPLQLNAARYLQGANQRNSPEERPAPVSFKQLVTDLGTDEQTLQTAITAPAFVVGADADYQGKYPDTLLGKLGFASWECDKHPTTVALPQPENTIILIEARQNALAKYMLNDLKKTAVDLSMGSTTFGDHPER